ncbi:MAG: dihydroorotate dehydrogenase [Paracoccaceae bacterium]
MTSDAELDDLFRKAQATPAAADDAFMARVLADALAAQPAAPGFARSEPRRGLWARLAAALGGAVAVAGISTAAMAGLVIGYVQPEPMVNLAGSIGLTSVESLNLESDFDTLLSEDMTQ